VLFICLIRNTRSFELFALGSVYKYMFVCVRIYIPTIIIYIYTCIICQTVVGKRKCFPFKLGRLIDFPPARRTAKSCPHSRTLLGSLFRFFFIIALFWVSLVQELLGTNWLPRRKAIVKSQLHYIVTMAYVLGRRSQTYKIYDVYCMCVYNILRTVHPCHIIRIYLKNIYKL